MEIELLSQRASGFDFHVFCPFVYIGERHDYMDGVEMDWKHQGWVSESDLLSWTLRCNLEEWWSVWAIQEIKSKGFDNEFEFVVV